jgi:peptidyl-prolyl cis-trans isomerase D
VLESFRSAAKYIWILLIVAFVGGFLIVETSGLLGRAPVTAGTAVGVVNGTEIPYQNWIQLSQTLAQQEEARSGRGLTLDERARIEDEAFNQLVTEILLQQEYEKRGIRVTDQEIIDAARFSPPPQLMQSSELQTDGRFDFDKYQRFLKSPAAKQQGLLLQLEQYYREQLPREKLYQQVASNVWVSDARLWSAWRDQRDSAVATFVRLVPEDDAGAAPAVTDAEIKAWYDAHKAEYDRPGRALVSVLEIPRTVTAADSTAALERVRRLRAEIVAGQRSFEDVARAESADTASGREGGSLGTGVRGRFVKPFEDAAYALRVGQVSEPVLTNFGWHLIKLEARTGDELTLRHVLVRIVQSDSSAIATDRRADSLAAIAANAQDPARFDSAARTLKLAPTQLVAFERDPLLTRDGRYVPSVSAWAFGGARVGETSDLFDAEDGYWIARLDSLREGGVQPLDVVRDEIRARLEREKRIDRLVTRAAQLAADAKRATLESAASTAGLATTTTAPFARLSVVPGLGRANAAIGAAFGLPVGQVSAPIRTNDGVVVLRVDRRSSADSAAWVSQKQQQRQFILETLRQQRVRDFLENLRKQADVDDRRKGIQAAARRTAA